MPNDTQGQDLDLNTIEEASPPETKEKSQDEFQNNKKNLENFSNENLNDDLDVRLEDNQEDNQEDDQEDDSANQETRWKEGDEVDLVRVRFPGNSKSFAFLVGKRNFSYGQKVVAMSDRGLDVGYINSFPYKVSFKKTMLPLRSISKVATQEDIETMQGNFYKQKEAERVANQLITDLNLDMQITHVEIIQYGKKMVFYFTAPSRVDFRDLVKKLVGELKMRIELRQISVRDRAAALGSIGACGLATCCSTFLKNYGNVSIKMAKNQNLALIPSKINGVCGQIKCCIKYEDDVYSDKRKNLPKEGSFIEAANGDKGKVLKLHILLEQFNMITDKGQIRRYAKSEFKNGSRLGKDYKFPESFKHVVNETSNVIGLSDQQQSMAQDFNKGLSEDEVAMKNLESLNNEEPDFFDMAKENLGSVSGSPQGNEDSQDAESDDVSLSGAAEETSQSQSENNREERNQSSRPNKKRNNKRRRPTQNKEDEKDQNRAQRGNNSQRRRNRNRKPKPEGQ